MGVESLLMFGIGRENQQELEYAEVTTRVAWIACFNRGHPGHGNVAARGSDGAAG
jgi:hypothetical protein